MKKLILVLTFATQLGSAAFANKIDRNSNQVISNANQASFQQFIQKQAPMFYQVDTDNWKTFQRIVSLYSNSKADLFRVSEQEKRNFLLSSEQLVKELTIMNSMSSKPWIESIVSTTAVIKFTWEVLEINHDVQFERAPAMPPVSKMDTNFIGM